jgi:acyl carrier protein
MSDNISRAIIEEIKATLEEAGKVAPELTLATSFLNGGLALDSLDFAVVVVRLEKRLGCDPFNSAALDRMPTTIGELAEVYERALAER